MNTQELMTHLQNKVVELAGRTHLHDVECGRFFSQCAGLIEISMGFTEADSQDAKKAIKNMRKLGPMDRKLFLETIECLEIPSLNVLIGYWDEN